MEWAKSMNYDGIKNVADLKGNVKLDRDLDHLEGQEMHVDFEPVAAAVPNAKRDAKAPATAPAEKDPLALGIGRYGSSQPSKVRITEKVKLTSRSEDEKKCLVRRLTLQSENLVYDVRIKEVTIDGPGMFFAEDYRPPKPSKANADAGSAPAEQIDSPSQTLFTWQGLMKMSQADRTVLMDGQVGMNHRGGKDVLLDDAIRGESLPQWGDLTAGRHMTLECDKLLAQFDAPPTDKAATKPAADPPQAGLTAPGPLRLLQATGRAMMTDEPRRVIGQQLIYDGTRDLVKVYGNLPGEPIANAQVILNDPARGPQVTAEGPEITWDRKSGKIEAAKMRASGSTRDRSKK
jgi:hypothetical protein